MKFLFDHGVPDELSHFLRQLGHEVRLLRDELPRDTPDDLEFSARLFSHERLD